MLDNGSLITQIRTPLMNDTEVASVLATLGQVEQLMPYLIGLSRDERARLAKVGDRTQAFVDSALALATANPGIMPRSMNLSQLEVQTATLANLAKVLEQTRQLQEKLSDTHTQLSSELYAVARTAYAVMKTPARLPGLNDKMDRLSQRFARKTNRRPDTTTTAVKAA